MRKQHSRTGALPRGVVVRFAAARRRESNVTDCVISGTGLYTPAESISNEELVASHIESVRQFNHAHAAEIEAGEPLTLPEWWITMPCQRS